jgi:lipopolysaccharide export system protein LptA
MILRASLAVLSVLAGLALVQLPAISQTVDTKDAEAKTPTNVDIEADQMEILDEQKKAIFKGKVKAVRGKVTLNCDTLVVTYTETADAQGEKKTDVTFLDASGSVVIVTSGQTVTGTTAHMDVKANKVTVKNNVKVVQGKTVINGQQLFVDLNTNKSEMTGGRVKGSFVPGQ